jgi:di/tricarboxylate transporter
VPVEAGDTLLVEGVVENLARLRDEQGVGLLTDYKVRDEEIAAGAVMAEGLVAPNSTFVGKSLREVEFRRDYGGFVLAIRRVGATLREKVANIPLHAADSLLMLIRKDRLEELGRSGDVIILAEHAMTLKRERFWWLIFLILPTVITLAALEIVDIGMAALLGAVLLLLVGAISPQEAYRSIEWPVIFLIAAFIPVGQAMIDTGTAAFLAAGVLAVGELFPPELAPPAVLALVYLLTMLLTQTMSNNAAALIVAPLAFSIAASLGVDSRPFLIAICFAASAEFMTPIGYQTNLMVYGPGSYRFFDYTRFGAPLDFGFWLVGVLLIPRFFPFHPVP